MRSRSSALGGEGGRALLGLLLAATIVGLLAATLLRQVPWLADQDALESRGREILAGAGEAALRGAVEDLEGGAEGGADGGGTSDGRDTALGELPPWTPEPWLPDSEETESSPPPPAPSGSKVLAVDLLLATDGALAVRTPHGLAVPSRDLPPAGRRHLELVLGGERRYYVLDERRLVVTVPPSLAERIFEEHDGRGNVRLRVLRPGRLYYYEPHYYEPPSASP